MTKDEQFVYFHCPDLPDFKNTIFRYSYATRSYEFEKIPLPTGKRGNLYDTRVVQKGQTLLVFKTMITEIHVWKLQGLESEELRIEFLAKLALKAKHFALAFDHR